MMKKLFLLMVLFGFLISSSFATGITFTFANQQITGTSPKYLEFDVMAAADAAGTKLGDTQVYINYNTAGFGTNVNGNGKITVTKGTLINNAYYSLMVNDNTTSRVSITAQYNLPTSPELGSELPTAPTQLLHIKMEIADPAQTADLSFQQSLMVGQQYESDNQTKYDPVVASDTYDGSLPVELTSFSISPGNNSAILKWSTASEVNTSGFEIYRATEKDGDYVMVASYQNNPALKGAGNSNEEHHYQYTDVNLVNGITYWYKLADVTFNGHRNFHEAVSVIPNASGTQLQRQDLLPESFQLHQNYPNPFNPTTTIRFDIPAVREGMVRVQLVIFNTLGKQVRSLYQGSLQPGSYTLVWDGRDDAGNAVASGLYFYSIRTDNYFSVKKMMLLK